MFQPFNRCAPFKSFCADSGEWEPHNNSRIKPKMNITGLRASRKIKNFIVVCASWAIAVPLPADGNRKSAEPAGPNGATL